MGWSVWPELPKRLADFEFVKLSENQLITESTVDRGFTYQQL